jgi:hypothetical protein
MPHRPQNDFKHNRLILCEGPDDVSFLSALLKAHGLPQSHLRHTGSERKDRGGKSRFGEKLLRLNAVQSFRKCVRHILIFSDSDDNEHASFQGIRRQINNAGFIPPTALRQPGVGDPKISIYMVPPGTEGCLECYLQDSARAANQLNSAHVDAFVESVTQGNWSANQAGKLWFRSSLAASHRSDPCINLSPALAKPNQLAVRLDHPSLNGLVAFLRAFGT